MRDEEIFKKDYMINSDSEINYDDPPVDEEDDEEPADFDEGDEEEKVNNVFNEQDKFNKKIMQQTPFGQPVNNWGTSNNSQSSWGNTTTPGSSWGNTSQQQFPWQRNPSPSWGTSSGSSWGGGYSSPQNNSWGSNEKREINRQKKVIFCDVLDCLIETFQSNGKPGLLPRGIYDVRLRFEVWDKLACFNPEKIYAIIPGSLLSSSNGSNSWRVLLDYVICALSEYLRVPYTNCQIIIQSQLGQTKDTVISSVLKGLTYDRDDVIHIGLNSGLYGQSDKDLLTSKNLGIDYLDLGQLLSLYY